MLALYMSFIDDESQRRLFEEIYLNYRKQMLLVARSVLGSDTDAEDVVHDVFLKIAKDSKKTHVEDKQDQEQHRFEELSVESDKAYRIRSFAEASA